MFSFIINDCIWQSDWNGYEVGFDDIPVVGLYSKDLPSGIANFYINTDTNQVIDVWVDSDE